MQRGVWLLWFCLLHWEKLAHSWAFIGEKVIYLKKTWKLSDSHPLKETNRCWLYFFFKYSNSSKTFYGVASIKLKSFEHEQKDGWSGVFNSLISDKVCPSQALDIFVDQRLEEAPTSRWHRKSANKKYIKKKEMENKGKPGQPQCCRCSLIRHTYCANWPSHKGELNLLLITFLFSHFPQTN